MESLLIILNLVLVECLLSIDNIVVLTMMVGVLPPEQRGRALRYGIVGAYFFRFLMLIIASWITALWFLKPVGGIYLLYLTLTYLGKQNTQTVTTDTPGYFKKLLKKLPLFWRVVIAVELVDLTFSVDNVIAAVAMTDKLWIIYLGVGIGILGMRFIAQYFIKLMYKYPGLKTSAFIVIGVLGIKLCLTLFTHYYPLTTISVILESHTTETFMSILNIIIFVSPIAYTRYKNYKAKSKSYETA